MTAAFPKPVRSPKEPKPLRPKRWGVSRSARGTKHSRRPRDFDRMRFLSDLGSCAVSAWFVSPASGKRWVLTSDLAELCSGRIEVAHLSLGKTAGRRRAPDAQTAPICHQHHTDIDGKIGGKGPWYVALGYEGQQKLRRWLIDWADAAIDDTRRLVAEARP